MKTTFKFKAVSFFIMFIVLLSCDKKEEEKKEIIPTLIGKWNFTTRTYQDATTPKQTETHTGKGYYIQIMENLTYNVLFEGENGSGKYVIKDNTIDFTLLSGDDDITDEGTYTIKTLTSTEAVLEQKDGSSIHELRFTK